MNLSVSRFSHWPLLVAILCVGFFLRIWQLDSVPLRGDEAFAADYWAELPLTESLARIAPIEPHPPLTYALFRLWGLWVGTNSEFALRMLPALVNLVGAATLYALGKRLHSHSLGILAALIWALHPFEIWHARDFRNYAIWATLSAQTLYWGWRTIHQGTRRNLMAYAAVALVGSLIFYFELFTVAAVCVSGSLLIRNWQTRLRWIGVHTLIVGITGAVFWMLQRQLIGTGGYGGNTASFDLSALLTVFPSTFAFGESFPLNTLHIAGICVVVVLMACIFSLRRSRHTVIFLVCTMVIPVLLLSLVSLRVAVFTPRYAMGVVAPLILFAGLAALTVWQYRIGRRLVVMLSVLAVLMTAQSLYHQFTVNDYRKSPDWYAVRDYLAQHVNASATIIQTTVDAAFGYYVNPLANTAAVPASPLQTAADIDAVMRSITAQSDTIWVFEHSFYDWPNAHAARQWLDAHWQPVTTTTVMGKTLIRYRPFTIEANELLPALNRMFGDSATLRSAHYTATDQDITVWLYWQPPTDPQWNVSVQVIGGVNPKTNTPVWVQSDRPLPISEMQTRDVHLLNTGELPAGNYNLIVKVYDPTNGNVLLTESQEYWVLGPFNRP